MTCLGRHRRGGGGISPPLSQPRR